MIGPAIPLALLWLGGGVAIFFDGRRPTTAWFAVAVLLTAMVAMIDLLFTAVVGTPREVVTGGFPAGVGIRLRADALGAFFALLSLLAIVGALLFETLHGIRTRSLPAVLLLLATGLTGLFLTADAFNFYVFFELSMIASFVLTSYAERPSELRAAVVFALVNLIGSALFLSGIAALYRLTGTLDMTGLARGVEQAESPAILAATLLFVALGLKVGMFPLHFWLPAVYRGARPVVAAVLAGAVANIGTYGLLRFGLEIFTEAIDRAGPILLTLGGITVLYGGVLAASRRAPTEVLGYSAIGQAGFVLVALAVGGPVAIAAAVFYAGINAANKVVLFLAGGVRGAVTAAAFVVGAFSVAGVPPTVGFAGKLELFRMGVVQEHWPALLLVAAGGALSFIYMFQAYQHTYWVRATQGHGSPRGARIVLVTLAVLLIATGLWPEPMLQASHAAAEAVLGPP